MTKEIQEKLKVEALRRMKALQLHDGGFNTCVGDFRKNGTPWKSEFHGILYWLDEDEAQAVKEFEEEHENYKVYHCYKAHTQFGEILYMLYVSDNEDDTYEQFMEDLEANITFTYAYNFSEPMFSEFGSATIYSMFGGIQIC